MASVCNAQFTDDKFEAALSNSLQHFCHISGLKREQKLCLETVAQKRDVFGILSIAVASTERLVACSKLSVVGDERLSPPSFFLSLSFPRFPAPNYREPGTG